MNGTTVRNIIITSIKNTKVICIILVIYRQISFQRRRTEQLYDEERINEPEGIKCYAKEQHSFAIVICDGASVSSPHLCRASWQCDS